LLRRRRRSVVLLRWVVAALATLVVVVVGCAAAGWGLLGWVGAGVVDGCRVGGRRVVLDCC